MSSTAVLSASSSAGLNRFGHLFSNCWGSVYRVLVSVILSSDCNSFLPYRCRTIKNLYFNCSVFFSHHSNMATQSYESSSTASPEAAQQKHSAAHPLCPLDASEISRTADLIKSLWPTHTDLRFKVITLDEPSKKSFIPYLDAEHSNASLPFIPRKAFVAYYIRNTVRLFLR